MKYDVCVFGGCALDQIFYQNIDGTYDERPNTIAPGGKGANQAVAASRAGAKTTIITRIGKDNIGKKILENLEFNLVDTSHVEMRDGLQNDYANIRINRKDKDNEIERFTGAIDSFTTDLIENNKQVLLKSKIIVCQLKCPKSVTEALVHFCAQHNKLLILTPCRPEKLSIKDPGNLELIEKIDLITCNQKECQTIFQTEDVVECVKNYPNKLIVTLGKEGLIYHNGKRVVKMPAIPADVLDTTGAGDTLNGNLSAFLAKGLDLPHALRKAMYAATMKLTKQTAQAGMPYLDDLETFIMEERNKEFRYGKELQLALEKIKAAYESVKYASNFNIYTKDNGTLVTDVDFAIEQFLIEEIKKMFPQDQFVTEENFPNHVLGDRTWVIDPIDGTSHFLKKDSFFGIQLAFYDRERTRFSVIYLPEKEELYYAAEGCGAYLNNNKILEQELVPIQQSVVEFCGSLHYKGKEKLLFLKKLMKDHRMIVSNVLHINSCCVAYTNLVSSKTDALISSVGRPWDVMPGEFLCKECGISITYLDFKKEMRLLTKNDAIKDILLEDEQEKKDL